MDGLASKCVACNARRDARLQRRRDRIKAERGCAECKIEARADGNVEGKSEGREERKGERKAADVRTLQFAHLAGARKRRTKTGRLVEPCEIRSWRAFLEELHWMRVLCGWHHRLESEKGKVARDATRSPKSLARNRTRREYRSKTSDVAKLERAGGCETCHCVVTPQTTVCFDLIRPDAGDFTISYLCRRPHLMPREELMAIIATCRLLCVECSLLSAPREA